MEIIDRIFNQRAVASGEINLLISSFDKILKTDEKRLENTHNVVSNTAVINLPNGHKLVADMLPIIQAKVLICSQMCDKMLKAGAENVHNVSHSTPIQKELDKINQSIQQQRKETDDCEKSVENLNNTCAK